MASIELPTTDALDLIAGTGTAAFAMDRHEKIIYWNAAAEKLLGWSADDVLGKACFSVLAGRDPFGNLYCMRDCAIVRTAVNGGSPEPFFMEVAKKKGGSQRVKVRVLPLPSGAKSTTCVMHLIERGDAVELDRLIGAIRAAARPSADAPPADPLISALPADGARAGDRRPSFERLRGAEHRGEAEPFARDRPQPHPEHPAEAGGPQPGRGDRRGVPARVDIGRF